MAHVVSCGAAVRIPAAVVTAVAAGSGSRRSVPFSSRVLPGLRSGGGVVRKSRNAGFSRLRATRLTDDNEDEGLVIPISDESELDTDEIVVDPVAFPSAASLSEAVTDFTTDLRETVTGTGELKQALIDNFYGTERGLRASGETRGEIVEIISQLEALNPTPSPTEATALLDGKWILAYTSFSELFPFLAAGNLPLVKVGEISQTIDAASFSVENSVSFTTPLATASFGANASFSVRSPKRVQVKFLESVIGTPQITDSLELPSELSILGQTIDIRPLQALLQPVQSATSSLAKTLSEQPALKIPFPASMGAESWLLTTYLDEDIRVSRGDGNSVFVLVKEGSPFADEL